MKTTFLHNDLQEDIYIAETNGFQESVKKSDIVCKLKNSLYGIKQAPWQWYMKFDDFMIKICYTWCVTNHCYYIKHFESPYIILLLYVDDILISESGMREINRLKKQFDDEFEMKDLGASRQKLGMSITRNMTNDHYSYPKKRKILGIY